MATEVLLKTVVPIGGVITSSAMYAAPLGAAYRARASSSLGDLNPLPMAVTFISTSTWIAYGMAAHDAFVLAPNLLGLVAALYCSAACLPLAPRRAQDIIIALLCAGAFLVPFLGVMHIFVIATQAQRMLMWGVVSNAVTIIYYGAPLSTAIQVVRSRNSASIYTPLAFANLANAALWVAYGAAVADVFIVLPNACGAVCALAMLALVALFPAKRGGAGASSDKGSRQDLLEARGGELSNKHGKDALILPSSTAPNATGNGAWNIPAAAGKDVDAAGVLAVIVPAGNTQGGASGGGKGTGAVPAPAAAAAGGAAEITSLPAGVPGAAPSAAAAGPRAAANPDSVVLSSGGRAPAPVRQRSVRLSGTDDVI